MAQVQTITYDINDLKPSFRNPDDMPTYISPYEIKPKKPRKQRTTMKPRVSKYTEEEIKQKKNETSLRYYYDNYEYNKLKQQIYYENNKDKILLQQKEYKAKKNNGLK